MRANSVVVLVLLAIYQAAAGQTRVLIQEPPREEFGLLPPTTRVALELQLAVQTNSNFIGTHQFGEPVLEVATTDATTAVSTFTNRPGVAGAEVFTGDPYNPIDELVIIFPLGQAPAGTTFAGTPIVYRQGNNQSITVKPNGPITASLVQNILADPNVRYVEPNFLFRLPDTTIDYTKCTDVDKQWGLGVVGATRMWPATPNPVVVAVLDTGIDLYHENLTHFLWEQPETPYNGCAHEVHGCDFFDATGLPHPPQDEVGHGTHCAGVISQTGGNTPERHPIQLMAVRVAYGGNIFTTADKIANAIDYAVARGAKIINCSFQSFDEAANIADAINRARVADVLVVAAAGNALPEKLPTNNNDHPVYPASYNFDNIVSVLSVDPDQSLTKFSNFGKPSVDLGAPGGCIYSTVLSTNTDHYGFSSGTSMATAFVSGVAALLYSTEEYKMTKPADMKEILKTHARPLPALEGKCVTGGVLDLSYVPKSVLTE